MIAARVKLVNILISVTNVLSVKWAYRNLEIRVPYCDNTLDMGQELKKKLENLEDKAEQAVYTL